MLAAIFSKMAGLIKGLVSTVSNVLDINQATLSGGR
jgi:hypothetical protein